MQALSTSTTISAGRPRPVTIAGAIGLVVAGWLSLMFGLTFAAGPEKSIAIIGPQA